MLKVKTKTHKFRRIADDLRSDVKAPLVEALETFYKKPMIIESIYNYRDLNKLRPKKWRIKK